MPGSTRDAHYYDLARQGAEARLQDVLREMKLLIDLFPDLRDSFDPDELPISFLVAKGSGQPIRQGAGGLRGAREIPSAGRRGASAFIYARRTPRKAS